MDAFDHQTRAYGKMLRWGQFDQAAEMRQAKAGSLNPVALDKFKEIRVTSYQIVRSQVSSDMREAVVHATIDYYHERQNEVRTLSEQQLWWYEEEQGKWFLDGDLPDFLL